MKVGNFRRDAGSLLLVTITTIAIIAIALTSYLALVSNQNRSVARAAAWNQAIPVLEGGIEEALTQIHYCGSSGLATNNWTLGADGLYHKTRAFKDGSYYSVSIQPANPPIIVSTGYVVVPFSGTSPTQYVSRRVRVTTRNPIAGGINAKGDITMSGNGLIDSYDSTDPNHSNPNGTYNPATREANTTVLTDGGNISATRIYGYATTGPTGTVSGTVGDTNWTSGLEPGHVANNANVQFNDVPNPFTYGTGLPPNTGILGLGVLYGLTNYNYQIGNGNYNMPSLSMSSSDKFLVTGNPSVLYISGSVNISGQAYIYIAPGASLKMYVGGPGNSSFSGGGLVNGTGPATNMYVYGLTNCTGMQFSGSSVFDGVVYAPDAAFQYSGSSDFSGSLTAASVTISGNGNFHYDQSIGGNTHVVVSWNEF